MCRPSCVLLSSNAQMTSYHELWKSWIFITPKDTIPIHKCVKLVSPPTAQFNPPFAASSDFVAVPVRIFVNDTVELATRDFKFYNCAATVRKSENTPWVSLLIYQFCSVTHWKYTATLNTASTDNLDVNVSPCMNRWEIKALFINCDAW